MPPPVALLLCTAFILFLLRIERRQSAGVSGAVWIPTLWMLAIASKPLGIWFGTVGDAESGSPLDRLFLSGLLCAGVIVLVRRQLDWRSALRENPWLLALLGYMFVSTLWSEMTLIALKRWGRECIMVIMALVMFSEPNRRQAFESLLRRCVYILIPFSILLIKYYPALGVSYGRWSGMQMWIGVTVHKNTLGRLCLVATVFLLWALYCRWQARNSAGQRYDTLADATVLVIAMYLMKGPGGAYSATSIATFAVGIVILIALTWLRKQEIRIPAASLLASLAFLIGFGTVTPFVGGSNVASFSSTFGRDESLTGRTEIWAELVPVVQRQPFLGSGFGSFWTSERRDSISSHGHNGYLDILLDLGAVGLGLYAILLLSCGRKLHAALAMDYEWASLGLCFLLMAVVYNYSESALGSLAEQMTAVFIFVSTAVSANEVIPRADCVSDCCPSSATKFFAR